MFAGKCTSSYYAARSEVKNTYEVVCTTYVSSGQSVHLRVGWALKSPLRTGRGRINPCPTVTATRTTDLSKKSNGSASAPINNNREVWVLEPIAETAVGVTEKASSLSLKKNSVGSPLRPYVQTSNFNNKQLEEQGENRREEGLTEPNLAKIACFRVHASRFALACKSKHTQIDSTAVFTWRCSLIGPVDTARSHSPRSKRVRSAGVNTA